MMQIRLTRILDICTRVFYSGNCKWTSYVGCCKLATEKTDECWDYRSSSLAILETKANVSSRNLVTTTLGDD